MPHVTTTDELVEVINLLLHEVRTPLSVAQGYLRLLMEGRISDSDGQQRALAQSLEALGRIGRLCAGAGEFTHAGSPGDAHQYPATELLAALATAVGAGELTLGPAEASGQVRALEPVRAAAAITTIVAAVRRRAPDPSSYVSTGVVDSEFVVTSGGGDAHDRLRASRSRDPFNPWRGGQGLLLPLAVKQLSDTGAHLWTLADEPSAVAIALPWEPAPA